MVGSCNVDLVAFVERAPERGETVSGLRSTTGPGGKGANQAIAAARLGGAVSFVGAVGDDAMGATLRVALVDAGVDVTHLRRVGGETGTAHIVVESRGANRIVVVPGANGSVTSLSERDRDLIASSDLLLVQLELPLEVVVDASRAAREAGVRVILYARAGAAAARGARRGGRRARAQPARGAAACGCRRGGGGDRRTLDCRCPTSS